MPTVIWLDDERNSRREFVKLNYWRHKMNNSERIFQSPMGNLTETSRPENSQNKVATRFLQNSRGIVFDFTEREFASLFYGHLFKPCPCISGYRTICGNNCINGVIVK